MTSNERLGRHRLAIDSETNRLHMDPDPQGEWIRYVVVERLRGELEAAQNVGRIQEAIIANLKASEETAGPLPHASAALKDFMSELGEIMGMEDGATPAAYLQRARDIRQWCSDHQSPAVEIRDGDVEAQLESDRELYGMAYWREIDGRKERIDPITLRMRTRDPVERSALKASDEDLGPDRFADAPGALKF